MTTLGGSVDCGELEITIEPSDGESSIVADVRRGERHLCRLECEPGDGWPHRLIARALLEGARTGAAGARAEVRAALGLE